MKRRNSKWRLRLLPKNVVTEKFDESKLMQIDKLNDAIDYLLKTTTLINAGATRLVFDYDSTKVLKIVTAKLNADLNKSEVTNYYNFPQLFTKTYLVKETKDGKGIMWFVAKRVQPMDEDLVLKLTGLQRRVFLDVVTMAVRDLDSKWKEDYFWNNVRSIQIKCRQDLIRAVLKKIEAEDSIMSRLLSLIKQYTMTFPEDQRKFVILDLSSRIVNFGYDKDIDSIVILDSCFDKTKFDLYLHMKDIKNAGRLMRKLGKYNITKQDILDHIASKR